MQNGNQMFKVSKDSYGFNTVTYNGVPVVVKNKYNLGTAVNLSWGDTSAESEALAYAILNKVGSSEIAGRYAKTYTKSVISKIKQDHWTLNASAVIQWINENTNYTIDESAYIRDGSMTYQYEERRKEEDRRKEERRIQREKEFMEDAKRRLKLREERRKEDRRQEERRVPHEQSFHEEANLQEELTNCKNKIAEQNTKINECQEQLNRYKEFIESLNIKSVYEEYCKLNK